MVVSKSTWQGVRLAVWGGLVVLCMHGRESHSSPTQFDFQVFAIVWRHAAGNLGCLTMNHLAHKSRDSEQTRIVTSEDILEPRHLPTCEIPTLYYRVLEPVPHE